MSPHRLLLLGLGVLLVTAPIWAPPLDATGPDYEYRAALVTVDDNRIEIPREPPRPDEMAGIDCFQESEQSRLCQFEAHLVGESSRNVSSPVTPPDSGEARLGAEKSYVAFTGDGRVFERTVVWNESREEYVLGLERADASEVLWELSSPVDQYQAPVRQAVSTGSAQASEPLAEPVLTESSGRYYLVYTTGAETVLPEYPLAERLLELVGTAAGAVLIWRSGREWV